MPEAIIRIKDQNESSQEFNDKVLQPIWDDDSNPIGEVELEVVDGLPVVIMTSAMDVATEEEVEEGVAKKVGDYYLTSPPIAFSITSVDLIHRLERSEAALEELMETAGERVVDVQLMTGDTYKWVENPNTKDKLYLPAKITYVLVVWERDYPLGDEEAGDEDEDEEADDVEAEAADAEGDGDEEASE